MIYLIDTIGRETGMHLYDASFRQTLEGKGLQVTVLSNFDTDQRPALFPNFYHGSSLTKVVKFAWALLCMLCFRLTHHKADDVYVYQSFGLRKIDQFFIRVLLGWPKLYVIVHDIFEITGAANGDPRRDDKIRFYQEHIPAVICHSRDTEKELLALGYKGRTCFFPHFSYGFSKVIDQAKVSKDVRDAFAPDRVNFLFFGQLRETKGILILQQAIDYLAAHHPEFASFAHITIAGMDKGKLITHCQQPTFVTTILRYIDDSELNYLFEQHPVVLLPYTEIYQSGVLEVVIYFQCQALMSGITPFRQMLERYPSFGTSYAPNTPQALAEAMLSLCKQSGASLFDAADIARYQADHDPGILCQYLTGQ